MQEEKPLFLGIQKDLGKSLDFVGYQSAIFSFYAMKYRGWTFHSEKGTTIKYSNDVILAKNLKDIDGSPITIYDHFDAWLDCFNTYYKHDHYGLVATKGEWIAEIITAGKEIQNHPFSEYHLTKVELDDYLAFRADLHLSMMLGLEEEFKKRDEMDQIIDSLTDKEVDFIVSEAERQGKDFEHMPAKELRMFISLCQQKLADSKSN